MLDKSNLNNVKVNNVEGNQSKPAQQDTFVSNENSKSKFAELNSNIKNVRTDSKSESSNRTSVLKSEVSRNESTVSSATSKVKSQSAVVSEMEAGVSSASSKVLTLQGNVGSAKGSMEAAHGAYLAAVNQYGADSPQAKNYESKYESSKSDYESKAAELSSAEEELAGMSDELESAIGQLDGFQSQLNQASNSLAQSQSQLATLANGADSEETFQVGQNDSPEFGKAMSGISDVLHSPLSQTGAPSSGPGGPFLDAAKSVLGLIGNLMVESISKNAFINIAKHLTVKTLSQQGISIAESGIASETNGSTRTATSLKSVLAQLNAHSGQAEEGRKVWADSVAKPNFVKGVGEGNDNLQASA